MKSKKELYKIILDEYIIITNKDNTEIRNYFICNHIQNIFNKDIITLEEFTTILRDFQANKPSLELHEEFLIEDMWQDGDAWWWLSYQGELQYGIDIRTKFLEKLVDINDVAIL